MIGLFLTRRRFVQGAASVVLVASAPRLARAQAGGVLKIRSERDLQVLDPGWMIGGMEIDLQYACLGSLAVYSLKGGQLGWVPSDFVERIELVDPKRIEFKLKPGIQWSGDFGELSAEDVKYSYERIADPKNEAPWKDKCKPLDHVEVTDKHSGAIVLKEPFAPLCSSRPYATGRASILCKAATEKAGGRFKTEFPAICGPYSDQALGAQAAGRAGAQSALERAEAGFPEVHFIIIEDEKTAEIAYEAGDIDITTLSEETYARYKETPPAGSKLMTAFNNNWSWLGMNTEHPKLKDKRVRQAIQYAVDVQAALDAAYGGLAPARAASCCRASSGTATPRSSRSRIRKRRARFSRKPA